MLCENIIAVWLELVAEEKAQKITRFMGEKTISMC
jgi:hypothetical protein